MASEKDLMETGFVWSEYPDPNIYTYPDGGIMIASVNYLTPSVGVEKFVLEGLKPHWIYYIRGWAVTNNPGNYFNSSTMIGISTN